MSFADLASMIPDWLALTAGREISVGLSREEALHRAAILRGLLLERKVSPDHVVLDEDLKDVFHALVALVTAMESQGGEALGQEANAVYQFLARVDWPDDDFDEKKDLLTQCAEEGWRALGTSLAEVEKRRTETHPISTDAALSEPHILLAICSALRELRDTEPLRVADEAPRLYRWLSDSCTRIGVFDERDYFLGESAFLAGTVFRVLGRREEAELWLDRAEASVRHTVNPAPALANVSYARLALHHDMGRYKRVIELIPSLIGRFQKLGMHVEVLKCRFLEAASLKSASRVVESRERLEKLRQEPELTADGTLHGLVLSGLGELLSAEGRHEEASAVYQEALVAHSQSGKPLVGAHLKSALAESLRNQGSLLKAVEFYRAAIADYASLGMGTFVANLRVVVTETLLALDRPREAEWEILQALPTIEEQKMVPEGFAAVALLRESVKRRKADPNALRALREHLQKPK